MRFIAFIAFENVTYPVPRQISPSAQAIGVWAKRYEGIQCRSELAGGFLSAWLHANQAGVRVFAPAGVLVGCLAQLLGGAGNVEDVIHNLERQTQVPAELGNSGEL